MKTQQLEKLCWYCNTEDAIEGKMFCKKCLKASDSRKEADD